MSNALPTHNALYSDIDRSVNFILPKTEGQTTGRLEARYIRHKRDSFTIDLSSQTGCTLGCKMCPLTFARQVTHNATIIDYFNQARVALEHYRAEQPALEVVFNHCARGEPLSNKHLITGNQRIFDLLDEMAFRYKICKTRHTISTVMPNTLRVSSLLSIFRGATKPDIYYSLHSIEPMFRRKWLPNAMEANQALDLLKDWQSQTGRRVIIRQAIIAGENDKPEDALSICEELRTRNLKADIEIIDYNPISNSCEAQTPAETMEGLMNVYLDNLCGGVIRRVANSGADIGAGFGMIYESSQGTGFATGT